MVKKKVTKKIKKNVENNVGDVPKKSDDGLSTSKKVVESHNSIPSKNPSYGKIIFLVISLFLVFLVIYTLSNYSSEPVKDYSQYNGFFFEKDAFGFWETNLKSFDGEKNFVFRKHPLDVETLEFDDSALIYLSIVQQNEGYFTISIDPLLSEEGMMGVIGFDLANVMASYFGFPVKSGLSSHKQGEQGLYPVYSCKDSSPANFVVVFEKDVVDYSYQDEFCLVIGVNDFDETIRYTALFMYKALGVIY